MIPVFCIRRLTASVVFLVASFFATAQSTLPAIYANKITAAGMKTVLYKLASDEFEGRETATKGQHLAGKYIADQFESAGIAPRGDSSYFQIYPLEKTNMIDFSVSMNGKQFKSYEECFMYPAGRDIDMSFPELVFINPDNKDTSKNLLFNVQTIAVLFAVKNTKGEERISGEKMMLMKKNGAGASMGVFTSDTQIKSAKSMNTRSSLFSPENSKEKEDRFGPRVVITEQKLKEILKDGTSKKNLRKIKRETKKKNFVRYPLKHSMDVITRNEKESFHAENILGMIEGSDKKDEYIFITAHYDHLGKRNESIYYGADDDGSGTTAVIEIAKAFEEAKKAGHGPRRSIICMTVSGEEKGLLGSEYYVNHPIIPLGKIVADLNIDMIGRMDEKHVTDSNYIYLIGSDKLSSELHKISEQTNSENTKINLDYSYNDEKEPHRFYYRSDHYNFAKNNIPVIFYFNGTHADYHKPSDTPDKINYALMEKRSRLVFLTAWDLANREDRIVVDKHPKSDDTNKPASAPSGSEKKNELQKQ